MDESAPRGNSFIPPKEALVQAEDTLSSVTAQNVDERLGDNPSDACLADAIALACNRVGNLLHLVEEEEASEDELDEWLTLEEQLCQEALVRQGVPTGKGAGLMWMIAPFMERNGFVDACGWWVPRAEESREQAGRPVPQLRDKP